MSGPDAGGQAAYDTVVDVQTNDGFGKTASLDLKAMAQQLVDLRSAGR